MPYRYGARRRGVRQQGGGRGGLRYLGRRRFGRRLANRAYQARRFRSRGFRSRRYAFNGFPQVRPFKMPLLLFYTVKQGSAQSDAASTSTVFGINNLFDCVSGQTGAGYQPWGFDELRGTYDAFRVTGARVSLSITAYGDEVKNPSAPFTLSVGPCADYEAGIAAGMNAVQFGQRPGAKTLRLNNLESSAKAVFLKQYVRMNQWTGKDTFSSWPYMKHGDTSGPSNLVRLYIKTIPLGATTTDWLPTNFNCMLKITFYGRAFRRNFSQDVAEE